MNALIIDYAQDDPVKCTSRKMVRMGLATEVSRKFHAASSMLVLNPFAEIVLSPPDKNAKAVLAIDCSWNLAQGVFFKKLGGKHRRLPALLAANPTNYSKLGMLSSVEAVAATQYIIGDKEEAQRCLDIYKWGPTFLTLNEEPLAEYSMAESEDAVRVLEKEFFGQFLDGERNKVAPKGSLSDTSRWAGHGVSLGKFLPRSRMHDAEKRSRRRLATEQKRDPLRHMR